MTAWAGTYSVSSTYGSYSGHSAASGAGLRDNAWSSAASVWGTASSTGWIKIDVGSIVNITDTDIAPIPSTFESWGIAYLEGAKLQGSLDDSAWTDIITLSGHANDVRKSYTGLSGAYRYFRIYMASTYLGVGDWQLNYTAVAAGNRRRRTLLRNR